MFLANNTGAEIIREQMASAPCQSKTFEADPEIPAEEIFYIETSAPGMIATEKTIVGAEDSYVVSLFSSRAVTVSFGESVSAPQANVPFRVRVPFRAGDRLHLFHFFAGVGLRARNGSEHRSKKYS